jgi:uncharacterized membrane protein
MENSISIKGSILFGWERFKEAPWRIIWIIAVAMGISIITSLIFEEISKGGGGIAVSVIVGVLNFVVQVFIGMGLINVALRAHDSIETLELKDLWVPAMFWKYLFATIFASAITLIGFVLLIIPGLIAMAALVFVPYIVMDRSMGPIEAIKESFSMTKGNRLKLFFLIIVLALLNLLGAIALLVGLLITVPVSVIAIVHAYRFLQKNIPTVTDQIA